MLTWAMIIAEARKNADLDPANAALNTYHFVVDYFSQQPGARELSRVTSYPTKESFASSLLPEISRQIKDYLREKDAQEGK